MSNDLLVIESVSWLVLQNTNGYSLLIKLNTEKLIVKRIKTDHIIEGISAGLIKLNISRPKSNKVVNTNTLSDACNEKYILAVKIFEFLNNKYLGLEWLMDCHERTAIINQISKEFNISMLSVRRRLRDYLQSGMTITSLIPDYDNCGVKQRSYKGKKPGPKKGSIIVRDANTERNFTIMTSRYMASGAKMPYTQLYEDMLREFYSEKKNIGGEVVYFKYPKALRPSLYSLTNWIIAHTDEVERETKRQGKKVARNNFRPTFSDTIDHLDVKAIGSRFEMDEVETDFYLVNRINRNRVIGRAIVYFIVDVFSRAIVACGIGLDNNSWSGAELALLNLVENKNEYCTRFGINIDESEWPMVNVIPSSMIVDNGAEYLSKNFSRLTQEVGIGIDYVPPRMGSYKSNVEKKFDQMNKRFKLYLPGVIEKEKYGQPHIGNARLDINQFSKAVIRFIIYYNNKPMNDYPDNVKMFQNELILTPVNIWNYSLTKYNELKYIHDIETFKYCLLKQDVASITSNGIEYKSRYFICNDIEWLSREASLAALTKTRELQIRYDMRFPDIIYYEKDGYRYKAFLNCPEVINCNNEVKTTVNFKTSNSKFAGLLEPEIRDIIIAKKNKRQENAEIILEKNMNINYQLEEIANEAIKIHHGKNDTHGISENRDEEKKKLHLEQHIDVAVNNHDDILPGTLDCMSNDVVDEEVEFRNMSRAKIFRWSENQKVKAEKLNRR
jgi:hypothetical protein